MDNHSPAPLNQANRYAHIDAMRAFAVLLVIVMHAGVRFVPGDSGVTVFFAVSGFIITFLLLKEKDRTDQFNLRAFYRRRIMKLAPPFLLLVVFPTLIYGVFFPVNWTAFATQVFFSYNWAQIFLPGAIDGVLPGSSVVWSLAVEEQFYILFALCWVLIVRRRRWELALLLVVGIGIVISAATRLVLSLDVSTQLHAMRGTDARLEAILWGTAAALLLYRLRPGSPAAQRLGSDRTLVGAVALFLASFAIPNGWAEIAFRPTLWALAASAVILYGMMPGTGRIRNAFFAVAGHRLVQLLGLASYSVYLAHDEFIHLARWIFPSTPIAPALGAVAGVLVGIAVYLLVEKRVAAHSHRRVVQAAAP